MTPVWICAISLLAADMEVNIQQKTCAMKLVLPYKDFHRKTLAKQKSTKSFSNVCHLVLTDPQICFQ